MQSSSSDPGRATRCYSLRPSAAALTGALAAALVPQTVDAALVTVGGDGGVGSVTLENPGDGTNLGGLLLGSLVYYRTSLFSDKRVRIPGTIGEAVRSNQSVDQADGVLGFGFRVWSLFERYGAQFNSSDNWVPGRFAVSGVNDGRPIWGWFQFRLGSSDNPDPTVISFTYDDEATDDTRLLKPVGGFRVPESDPVPEPSTLGLFGLGLGAAFVSRMRRRKSGR